MDQLFSFLKNNPSNVSLAGLRGAASSFVAARLAKDGPCCCIVADEHQIPVVEADLRLFANTEVLAYPGHEIPPYTPLSPDQQITAARLSALYRFREGNGRLLITSIEALLRRIMPVSLLTGSAEYLEAGEDCDHKTLVAALIYLGYEQVALVKSVGDFSLRGGIIDIYPPPFVSSEGKLREGPIRLDFFGDTIDSLRSFDPISQRSTNELPDATLIAVTDILLKDHRAQQRAISRRLQELGEEHGWDSAETARISGRSDQGMRFAGMEFFLPLYYSSQEMSSSSVLDFLPDDTRLIYYEPEAIWQSMQLIHNRIAANYCSAKETGAPALAPADLFLQEDELHRQRKGFAETYFSDFSQEEAATRTLATNSHQLLKQEIGRQRAKHGLLAPLTDQIRSWQEQNERVIICCRSSRHTKNLAEMLTARDQQIKPLLPPFDPANLPMEDGDLEKIFLCDAPLSAGFSLNEQKLHILSENELFGAMRLGAKKTRKAKGEPINFTELSEGDIVVHRDHGLGIYRGLETVALQGLTNDFMLLEYRDGDKLFIPVDRLHLTSRYQGLSDRQPRIDKLGSQAWKSTTAKVKEEVWKVAHELLDIYAKREIKEGRQFSMPGPMYRELEESFPYDETPGQAQSIGDVLADLTGDRPMDRLVCGDVGYGKTEVAVRAAFKVVEDGYQVAVMVPTTVLAEQHAKTFAERLKDFPVSLACLNRFRTPAEQRSIVAQMGQGKVDIVIGTHRLLSKDVRFQNLGLLIVDEEHRFGVSHKEKLKKMRAEIDILTLTATPIPRTLQMSLLSIRDLSVISTPPEHRLPVKTFVARFDELVIKEAVSRELRRGGQVFFVHNRVKSIHKMAQLVEKLVPEAKIAVAHGQMGGKELEDIMVAFVNRSVNVLVATTIIESGLDIPSANTIIINRADTLGMAEIYQLRGRVGRSATQSFAYLLVPSVDHLSKDSRERLRALMDCSELGGGFKLAMSDLQIRGGGNLLGVSQSGNIAAIGYDLYLDLLQKTVADLKARAEKGGPNSSLPELDPEVKLQLSAFIPQDYIIDISQRYLFYRRISALVFATQEQLEELQDEMIDRYGPLPKETLDLFAIIRIKKRLARLGISRLEQGKNSLVFTFVDNPPLTPEMLLAFLAQYQPAKGCKKPKITPDGRLVLYQNLEAKDDLFQSISGVMDAFTTIAAKTGAS